MENQYDLMDSSVKKIWAEVLKNEVMREPIFTYTPIRISRKRRLILKVRELRRRLRMASQILRDGYLDDDD